MFKLMCKNDTMKISQYSLNCVYKRVLYIHIKSTVQTLRASSVISCSCSLSLCASRLTGPSLACVAQLALTATRAPDLESMTSMLQWRKGLITLAFSTRCPLRSVIKEQSSTTDPHQTRWLIRRPLSQHSTYAGRTERGLDSVTARRASPGLLCSGCAIL